MAEVSHQAGEVEQLRAEIVRLADARDEALERVRQLEDLIVDLGGARLPELGLTRTQARMFRALLRWPMVSKAQMMALLYGHRDDPPHDKIVDIQMYKMRQRLKAQGIVINTIWGVGWSLDEASRAKLKGGG